MTEIKAAFPCGDLSLEGVYSVPEGEGPFAAVAVCHPHPLYGGMMDNNVVTTVCQALTQASIVSLRFNFRGVGLSQGRYDNGIGEQDDVVAALSFIPSIEQADSDRLGLCGYSFGAGVAIDVAASDERVKALALVSPILSHPSPVESYTRPKLLLWGSNDLALPSADLKSFTEELPEPREYDIIPGADHFWWGHEDDIAHRIAHFFTEQLKPSS